MPVWTSEYFKISDKIDGDDFIAELSESSIARDAGLRKSRLSSAWSLGRRKALTAEQKVFDLIRIRNSISSIVRIHGAPRKTRVELATIGQGAAGMAGWADPEKRTGPFILLDSGIYDACDGPEMLDAYCGVAVHEAEHLISSVEIFKHLKSGKLSGEQISWINLLEDERIENLARDRSPGFGPYLHAVKRVMFENRKMTTTRRGWDELPDLDKILLIIFMAIRAPHLLTPEMVEWRTVRGEHVFHLLRGVVPHTPTTELEVYDFSHRLREFYEKLRADYDALSELTEEELGDLLGGSATDCTDDGKTGDTTGSPSPEGSDSGGSSGSGTPTSSGDTGTPGDTEKTDSGDGNSGNPSDDGGRADSTPKKPEATGSGDAETGKEAKPSSDSGGKGKSRKTTPTTTEDSKEGGGLGGLSKEEILERMARYKEAKKREHDAKASLEALEKTIDKLRETMKSLDSAEKITEKMKRDGLETHERSEKDLEKAKKLKAELLDHLSRGRFTIDDFRTVADSMSKVNHELSLKESKELAIAEDECLEFIEDTTKAKDVGRRMTIITHPRVDARAKSMYKAVHSEVRPFVNRCRDALRFRMGERRSDDRQLSEGHLDKRMLGRARSTDRIFKMSNIKRAEGIAICLLLDESGSMGSCTDPSDVKSTDASATALKIAVMFAEALERVPGVELEIYSYASAGSSHQDNLVKYLYGKKQPNKEAICGYGDGAQNYDHLAIREAGNMFKTNTQNKNRLMLVLSDGSPCGYGYGGTPAIRATRTEVAKLEKELTIVQVAIQRFESESMFTNVIRFLDLPSLTNDMRKLLVKVIRSVS